MIKLEDIGIVIEKLQYQVRILGEAINHEDHPIEALIMQMGWGAGDIDCVHDVFEDWDRRIEDGGRMDGNKFERDFSALSINCQTLKSIILAFHRSGQWTRVCEAYVDSFGDAPSMEYHGIMRRERD